MQVYFLHYGTPHPSIPICTQHNPAQCQYQMRDITMLINVLEHINAYGL